MGNIQPSQIKQIEDFNKAIDEVPVYVKKPGDDELNYRDLMEYLNEKVKNDLSR